jgi:AraC-like DNA-binding protein
LMLSARGSSSVQCVSEQLDVSRRTLERRFAEEVGLTPKEYCRVLRFRAALDQLGESPAVEAAANAGYFDQSHLIRDFQEFAGCTPRQYQLREYSFAPQLSHFSKTATADGR